MEKKTTFQVFDEMATRNKDIRVAPLKNIIDVRISGKQGQVTIGVDNKTAFELIGNKRFMGGFVIADKDQYEEIEKELQS